MKSSLLLIAIWTLAAAPVWAEEPPPPRRVEARTTGVTVIKNPEQAPPLPGQPRPAGDKAQKPVTPAPAPQREGELLRPRAAKDRPAPAPAASQDRPWEDKAEGLKGDARSDAKEAASDRQQELRERRERRQELREDRSERQNARLRRLLQEK